MGENESLDSFFAKKDKVKKKSTKTTISPDDSGPILEKKTQKAARKSKKDKENLEEEPSKAQQKSEDDEWKVIEEEKEEKDYPDLKIQNLSMMSKVDGDLGMNEGGGQFDGASSNAEKDSNPGPWRPVNSVAPADSVNGAEDPKEEEVEPTDTPDDTPKQPETEPEAPVKSQKYIPPGARNQGSSTEIGSKDPPPPPAAAAGKYVAPFARRQQSGQGGKSQKKKALDVSSVYDFPELGKP